MTREKLIQLAHAAQDDAGSLASFTKDVDAIESCMPSMFADPVAAFIAALLLQNGGDVVQAVYDFDFFFSELSKVKKAIQNYE